MKKTLTILLLLALLTPVAEGQHYRANTTFVFNADFARFRYDSTSSYVEVYFGFYPRLLSYDLSDSLYKGNVLVRTMIRKAVSGDTLLNQRLTVPVVITDTTFRNVNSTFVTQMGYAVPMGDYVLTVSAQDSLQPTRIDSVSFPLVLHPYPAAAVSSDLELCSEIRQSTHQSKLFEKNSLEVIPDPSLVFGVTSHPVSFYYLELYNLATDSTYTIKTHLIDGADKVVREVANNHKYSAPNVVDVGMVNVSSFPSGRYKMNVSVFTQGGVEVCSTQKVLYLSNPHIKQPTADLTTLNANDFAGMTSDELSQEFREAQYLASTEEMKRFGQLTTEEAKRNFLAKFWSDVQNARGGRTKEARLEYLHRIAVANQRYHGMGKQGWQTDRGRVYLLYGEPDEVERFPNSGDSKPYEIWHYYQIESGVEFDFVDRNGFGNYILVNSTKRGEIQDDGWQRFLQ
jgi:GWxTD domain-containing protein